jgi:uncharacterized protein (DUF1501 family)
MMNRRFFLRNGSVALAAIGAATTAPSFLTRALAQTERAQSGKRKKVLIAIFQRGAMDGLHAVVPYGEQEYYNLRPSLALPRPGAAAGPGQAPVIDLDGFFGLHPSLASFKPLYDEGQLAIIHAAGSPNATRSHFDAQDYMESATPGVKSTTDGWLNRYLQVNSEKGASPFRAVTLGATLPRTMQGKASAIAMTGIADFKIRTGNMQMAKSVEGGFEAMYAQAANDALRGTGKETFEAVKMLERINPGQYKPTPEAVYPRGVFGDRLRQIAQLIKSDVGLEIAFTDISGWDTHTNQLPQLTARMTELSQGVSALFADLQDRAEDVVILTMTEFGRTARENGNRGTDHGHGSVMFVVGGQVKGSKIYGKWPGLKTSDLNEGRDLAITTDFRDVFGEIASVLLGANDLDSIFPRYPLQPKNFKGFLSS